MDGDRIEIGAERLHALDAVRGFALLAGIGFHGTLSFLPGLQIWPVMDDDRSTALAVLFYVLHIFRMTLFFLIAGFFARMSLQRRGAAGFVGDRLKRIALPLLVGWPLLFAAIVTVIVWAAAVANGGALPKEGPPPSFTVASFPLTHLWFLYALLLLYAAALALRGLVVLVDWRGRLRGMLDAPVRFLVGNPLGLVLLATPLTAAFWATPAWPGWFGIPTPDTGLIPNPAAATGFGVAFGVGWLMNRQPELLSRLARLWPLHLALAIGLTVAALAMVGPAPLVRPIEPGGGKFAYAALYAAASWAWSLGLIGAAQRFLSGHSPARRYLADASYWLYLIHLPIVMALQVGLAHTPLPWAVKYPLILAIALVLMLGSYQVLVRHTPIGRVLNGRRSRRRDLAAANAGAEAA